MKQGQRVLPFGSLKWAVLEGEKSTQAQSAGLGSTWRRVRPYDWDVALSCLRTGQAEGRPSAALQLTPGRATSLGGSPEHPHLKYLAPEASGAGHAGLYHHPHGSSRGLRRVTSPSETFDIFPSQVCEPRSPTDLTYGPDQIWSASFPCRKGF